MNRDQNEALRLCVHFKAHKTKWKWHRKQQLLVYNARAFREPSSCSIYLNSPAPIKQQPAHFKLARSEPLGEQHAAVFRAGVPKALLRWDIVLLTGLSCTWGYPRWPWPHSQGYGCSHPIQQLHHPLDSTPGEKRALVMSCNALSHWGENLGTVWQQPGGSAAKTHGTPTAARGRLGLPWVPQHSSALGAARARSTGGDTRPLQPLMAVYSPFHTDCDTWTSVGISYQHHQMMLRCVTWQQSGPKFYWFWARWMSRLHLTQKGVIYQLCWKNSTHC